MLRFLLAEAEAVRWEPAEATVDVGEGGRLLAVEVERSGGASIALDLGFETGAHVRSASTAGRLGIAATGEAVAIEVPRRGAGFEISYPSGNQ